ncbi:MAG: hypothetical protein KME47_25665 [Nodosilinea sp. WJT8-NPBG4]|jgi:hypothetical protein|nr:hypothetical protein [Nodosilinea sp. WJT8-NPBG4]
MGKQRWSVIFRKVTHGFRFDSGAELFAQVHSLVSTAVGSLGLEAVSYTLPDQSDRLLN